MIRTYQAEHGETVFFQASAERRGRTRLMALAVIVATALSAATVLGFSEHAAALARADVAASWAP